MFMLCKVGDVVLEVRLLIAFLMSYVVSFPSTLAPLPFRPRSQHGVPLVLAEIYAKGASVVGGAQFLPSRYRALLARRVRVVGRPPANTRFLKSHKGMLETS